MSSFRVAPQDDDTKNVNKSTRLQRCLRPGKAWIDNGARRYGVWLFISRRGVSTCWRVRMGVLSRSMGVETAVKRAALLNRKL